jgi:ectoine hydroxylase-related dioxygenase (phytanoyl-CoA dioxygenase family)
MNEQVKTFGVKEFDGAVTDLDLHVEDIKLAGYTILKGVLSDEEVATARTKLDDVYRRQTEEIGGRDNLEMIGDPYTAMCLLAYDEFFLKLAVQPRVLALVTRFLGEYFILMLQNGIINTPGIGSQQTAGHWHRDLGYQHFTSSRPLGITALYCIDEFNENTGGTRVLAGTHKTETFPSAQFVQRHQRVIDAEPGAVIVFDPMMYHCGGLNRSDKVRRAVNNTYTLPLVKQQVDLPQMLNGRYRDDPFLSRLLGYESEPDSSVLEFRRRRLERKLAGGNSV